MDERRETPARLPVARTPGELPPSSSRRGPRFSWRKLVRSPRGAVGLAALAAALLLWPFSGLSWIPWLAGLGALLVLRVLRLEGVLRGWDLPLAAVIVVAGLMLSTGPWAWALAASIGVLLAGLAQLPWWRLAAVGAVLCLVTGVGFGIASWQTREEQREAQTRAGEPMRTQLGETRPARVFPAMIQAVSLDDADPICRLLTPSAEGAVLAATKAPDCAAAVTELHRRVQGTPIDVKVLPQPLPAADGTWTVDGCATPWATAVGPALGRIHIARTAPSVDRYAAAGFTAC